MNNELDIAAILRDKPKGTKLWSPAFGDVKSDTIFGNKTYCIQVKDVDNKYYQFTEQGQLSLNGECVLFPSKAMQDWSKLAWKKGDVLIAGVDNFCIFDSWANDDYTEFYAKFVSNRYEGEVCKTSVWTKETKENIIKQYISNIEEIKCGKLNLSTLAIESKPQFKDGDIIYNGNAWNEYIAIFKEMPNDNHIDTYAFCYKDSKRNVSLGYWINRNDSDKLRLATEEEKQQLFDALAKESIVWDAEKEAVVDLPKKHMLKPFDKVLVRLFYNSWAADFFSNYDKENEDVPYTCIGGSFSECIPYNDQTAHLLGTTDDYEEGGE